MGHWTPSNIPSLAGTTAVVTGANSGIGLVTARELARAGADVVIACRDPARADQAARDLREQSGGRVTALTLDLADLGSVRGFVDRLLADRPRLDLLVNNAGVMALPRRETTVDGFERLFATNHLGHFALTGLLWPALLRSPAARVVTVSSMMAWTVHLDPDDLAGERRYHPLHTYSRTKLANLYFTLELDRRARGTGVRSVAAHPGATHTNLQRHGYDRSIRLIGQRPDLGAQPTLYAATAPDVRGGAYYGPRILGVWGAPAPARIPGRARDERIAASLWDLSERLTGVRFPAA